MNLNKTLAFVQRKGNKQYLYRVDITSDGLFGMKSTLIDEETIPDHVMTDLGCFGDVGNWKSKFSHVIGAENTLSTLAKQLG